MTAEVLVMCGECGRPQYPTGPSCVACGKPLPEAPPVAAVPRSPRDLLIDQYEPFLAADLGRGRGLALSRKRLEWRPGADAAPVLFELASLRSVELHARPAFEALILSALAGVAAAAVPNVAIRLLSGAVGLLALVACFAQKRYALRLRNVQGQQAGLFLGIGSARAPVTERIRSVWDSLSLELRSLGVPVEGTSADGKP